MQGHGGQRGIKTQEGAKLAATEAEAEAIAKAIQKVNTLSTAQQVEAPSTPLKKPKARRSGPRPCRFPRAGLSKEDVEHAQNGGWFGTVEGDGSDSDDSTEKRHQEEYLRARAEKTERHRQGSAMTGKEYLLINAEARSELLREEGLTGLDRSPWAIDIYVTVNGYNRSSCWKGPQLI